MSLREYWQKRDFDITSEPRGEVTKPGKSLAYYIQRHHARRLHYDFRLELDGTLKSWAVPKGPSLDPTDKRLAVHVEDHPLSYGTFEGQIPAGQYGAGEVVLWDKGVWKPIGDVEKGYRSGNLKFELQGEKLSGKWALVRMGKAGQDNERQENWLLIKEHDEVARSHDEYQITEARPESVLKIKTKNFSTKTMIKNTIKTVTKKSPANTSIKTTVPTIKTTELTAKMQPQLATLVKSAPSGDEWLCEIKYDGYRALTRLEKGKAVIYTRNGNDWTSHWPKLVPVLKDLPVETAWLDGEVVAFENGKINFAALQNYQGDSANIQLKYYVFDIVHLNGQDLSELPLVDRKALLKTLLESVGYDSPVIYSDHIVGNVAQVFKQACQQGLEGVVIKRADSTYTQARSQSWLKLKCVQRQEFVIGGYTEPEGERKGFGALLLGWYNEAGELVYAGRVGTGFNQQNLAHLYERMQQHETAKPAFIKPPRGRDVLGVHWLKPVMVAEVNFAEWTPDGSVRHASFVSLRDDKKANQITREQAIKPQELKNPESESALADAVEASSSTKLTTKAKSLKVKAADVKAKKTVPKEKVQSTKDTDNNMKAKPMKAESAKSIKQEKVKDQEGDYVAGIKISHPERVIFSAGKITKLELAQYYEAAERWIMPHIMDRPLSLLRCPEGADKECFFQKHLGELTLKHVDKIAIPGNDHGDYLVVRDISGLVELAQMGVIEFHTWGSTTEHIQQPDRIIFDLDPDPAVPWAKVIEGARLVEYLLVNLGLDCYLKTTGGKGLHIVVPIMPEHDFPVIKEFSKSIANHLAETIPTHFVAVMSKAKRKDKIFVDYLRNGEEATAIAAFSVRAREGGPISVPIRWEDLNEAVPSNFYNIKNIYDRLLTNDDPWESYFSSQQKITDEMLHTFD